MSEEAENVNNQEVVEPEANVSDGTPQEPRKDEKSDKELNFERLRKKNEELERYVRDIQEQFQRQQKPPPPPQEEDELSSLTPDDIITVSQANKLAEKRAKALIDKAFQERERASLPDKTRSKYDDYDKVMTKDNIEKFEQLEPGLADACAKASNPWETTYKMIRKFVLPAEEKRFDKAAERAEENLQKPSSIHSIGKRGPLSQANQWSEASKEQLYKEMMEAARRI
jgi:hypothetical protein